MPNRIPSIRHFLCRVSPVLFAAVLLAGCSLFEPPQQIRGNKVDPEQLKELTPGTSTRADVTALIGSPTARATFDDNTWLYISQITKPRVGRTQAVLDQDVVILTFTDQGVLRNIEKKTAADSQPVNVVDRTTPSPGTEASLLQQLLGNIGRFNPAGASSATSSGQSGGAPKPY